MSERRFFWSSAIGGTIEYRILAGAGDEPLPVVYLLHGRGDSSESWAPVVNDLLELPLVAVMPDAPWNSRAGYYIDSAREGGYRVETAFTRDLIHEVESRLDFAVERRSRFIGGYSMGGYGALRLALAHPYLFGAAIALSPAVYVPEPPIGSSARVFGAFGRGARRYDSAQYRELNYPALLDAYPADRPLKLLIAAGDAEPTHPRADRSLSMAAQVEALVEAAAHVPGIWSRSSRYSGGHDFGVWRPALFDALRSII